MIRFPGWLAIPLSVLAVAVPARRARGAEGLYLNWVDCALGPLARHDFVFACDQNATQQDLYCAFRLGAPADSVLGIEVVVDVQHADAALPNWWRFDPSQCRTGALQGKFDFVSRTACVDFLAGDAGGDLQGYYVGQPRGGANQARIRAAASVPPDSGYRQLDDTSMYYAARLTILDLNTAPPAFVCGGCADPACLVLNSVVLLRQPGSPTGDVVVGTAGEGNANYATWQGGAGANCAAVPVRAITWGRLKSLYR
jgi:hypothetical protein